MFGIRFYQSQQSCQNSVSLACVVGLLFELNIALCSNNCIIFMSSFNNAVTESQQALSTDPFIGWN